MYTLFKNIMSKPLVLLGILIVSLILGSMVSSAFSNLGTMLGFDTRENMAIRLEKTNVELDKASKLLVDNAKEHNLYKEIDKITKVAVVEDSKVVNELKRKEETDLNTINTTIEKTAVKEVVPSINKDKPTLTLSIRQKVALSILKTRAKNLKGAKL